MWAAQADKAHARGSGRDGIDEAAEGGSTWARARRCPTGWRRPGSATRIRYIYDEGAPGDLGSTVRLTSDGMLQAMCTPGHTPGSVTVRLTAAGMDPCAPTAGIHTDMQKVRVLQATLSGAGLLLPSHDPGVPARLREAAAIR